MRRWWKICLYLTRLHFDLTNSIKTLTNFDKRKSLDTVIIVFRELEQKHFQNLNQTEDAQILKLLQDFSDPLLTFGVPVGRPAFLRSFSCSSVLYCPSASGNLRNRVTGNPISISNGLISAFLRVFRYLILNQCYQLYLIPMCYF